MNRFAFFGIAAATVAAVVWWSTSSMGQPRSESDEERAAQDADQHAFDTVQRVEESRDVVRFRGPEEEMNFRFRRRDDQQRRKEHDLEHTTRELLRKYQTAESGQQRTPILQRLTEVVGEQFETRQRRRAEELEELEARVQKLRELHQKRKDAKSEIVQRRVDQLIREAEGLGWSGGGLEPRGALWVPGPTPPDFERAFDVQVDAGPEVAY